MTGRTTGTIPEPTNNKRIKSTTSFLGIFFHLFVSYWNRFFPLRREAKTTGPKNKNMFRNQGETTFCFGKHAFCLSKVVLKSVCSFSTLSLVLPKLAPCSPNALLCVSQVVVVSWLCTWSPTSNALLCASSSVEGRNAVDFDVRPAGLPHEVLLASVVAVFRAALHYKRLACESTRAVSPDPSSGLGKTEITRELS